MKLQIVNYFETNNLCTNSQFDFRKRSSTTLAKNEVCTINNNSFEKKEYVPVVYLDLTKVFDCVEHEILLKELELYNFTTESIDLIRSYLFNRKQFVMYEGHVSHQRDIEYGVSQGSTLAIIISHFYQ